MLPATVRSNVCFKIFVLNQTHPETALANFTSGRMRVSAILNHGNRTLCDHEDKCC